MDFQSLQSLLFPVFSVIGMLGVYIFLDFKKTTAEQLRQREINLREYKLHIEKEFEEVKKKFEKIEDSNKILSRQEFDEIKSYVKESIDTVINSKEFRQDLKNSISEILMHLDSNRSKGERSMFEHFENILNNIAKDIDKKLEERK